MQSVHHVELNVYHFCASITQQPKIVTASFTALRRVGCHKHLKGIADQSLNLHGNRTSAFKWNCTGINHVLCFMFSGLFGHKGGVYTFIFRLQPFCPHHNVFKVISVCFFCSGNSSFPFRMLHNRETARLDRQCALVHRTNKRRRGIRIDSLWHASCLGHIL